MLTPETATAVAKIGNHIRNVWPHTNRENRIALLKTEMQVGHASVDRETYHLEFPDEAIIYVHQDGDLSVHFLGDDPAEPIHMSFATKKIVRITRTWDVEVPTFGVETPQDLYNLANEYMNATTTINYEVLKDEVQTVAED